MHLEEILLEYGRKNGLGRLELDEEGICRLLINKTSTISLEKSLADDGFYLYSVVGALYMDKDKEVFQAVLTGNLFGKETGKASLGYDPQTRSIVLFEFIGHEGLTYSHFQTKLEDFIYYMLFWIGKCEELQIEGEKKVSKSRVHSHEDKNIFYA